ncbi:MAG: hypothetical protein Q8P25_02980 [Candidatus Curtissbacteria bacterium]|nr:hypothetical protein [Candidatus Curtissbacteria bacterium]
MTESERFSGIRARYTRNPKFRIPFLAKPNRSDINLADGQVNIPNFVSVKLTYSINGTVRGDLRVANGAKVSQPEHGLEFKAVNVMPNGNNIYSHPFTLSAKSPITVTKGRETITIFSARPGKY